MGEPGIEARVEKPMTLDDERRVLAGYAKRCGFTVRKRAGHETWRVYYGGHCIAWGPYDRLLAFFHGYHRGYAAGGAARVLREAGEEGIPV